MNWQNIAATAATIILSLGGGGGIVLLLANWIGKILSQKYVEKLKHEIQQEIESYKTRLRKSEFLFQKEFEAASAFISMRLQLLPRHRFPEMDWDEACEDFAHNFEQVENTLESYIATHGAVLQKETLERVANAKMKTSLGMFEVTKDNVSEDGIRIAEEVMNALENIEKELYQAVWSQSDT